jgi:hypothetical protein
MRNPPTPLSSPLLAPTLGSSAPEPYKGLLLLLPTRIENVGKVVKTERDTERESGKEEGGGIVAGRRGETEMDT